MRIDLHTHSTASDGTQRPADVVASARAAGLDVVALTDHDTTAGWDEAATAAAAARIGLVRGMEVSCLRDGVSVHLLAYLFDPADPGLIGEIEHARSSRATRMDRMVDALAADGIPITVAAVRRHMSAGATMGRPHLADALVTAGVVADRREAFDRYLHDDSPYYVSHYAVDPARAVELVRAAGGVSVLAHPFSMNRRLRLTDALVADMIDAGLDGIEVHHRDHDDDGVARASSLARVHGLVPTGSSDYHGAGKPNRLGENTTDPDAFERLLERARAVQGKSGSGSGSPGWGSPGLPRLGEEQGAGSGVEMLWP